MAGSKEGTTGDPEAIAVEALGFIAGDQRLFERFCGLTGLSAGEMRAAAAEPGFLSGVLEFVTAHEATLMAFCEASGHAPQRVVDAGSALAGGRGREWDSL
ncbi:DUF3572 family protein [Fulvimarina endophytica]|uniref:DUF3572 family protein n=1 Tax=Fulvimarina endophytica TaxID=2293836 RepID=A0A371X7U8_9HYPH|nr:DUF3572 domain-containing protein [Fulvimarina endophytica]RFC65261.1 DUF3572 family protein [Fulvimarina endophytica]